jgi:ribosomal protein L40E
VRNSVSRENRETVIDDNELNRALNQANAIKIDYFRLRALAVLSLLRLSGKRRTEISWVQLENFKVENDLLTVTFTLEKKKLKHKKCPNCNAKNSSTASFCKNCGSDVSRIPVHREVCSHGPSRHPRKV